MISKRYAQLLQTLSDHPAGLTTAQIFSQVDQLPDGAIIDTTECSRMVYSCRSSAQLTSFQDGKSNRHKITPQGLEDLNAYKAKKIPAGEAVQKMAETADKQLVDTAIEQPEKPHHNQDSEDYEIALAGAAVAQTILDDPLFPALDVVIESFVRDGYLILDPKNEIESQFIQIISAVKTVQQQPEPITIEHKQAKIAMLEMMQAFFGKFNDDMHTMLGEIIADIRQLEEVA